MKKGFTLVELLFVMAIIAILAGFAIANLKDSTKVATENSMKNDVKNGIASQNSCFATNQSYEWAYSGEGTNGILTGAEFNTKFTVSKGNVLYVSQADCDDGSQGYYVGVTNRQIEEAIQFNSCTDGTITKGELNDPASN